MGTQGFIWLTTDEQIERLSVGADDVARVCYGAYKDESGRLLELGKSWGGLHFLLTGRKDGGSPPLNFILDGGDFFGGVLRDECELRFVRLFASALLPDIERALDPLDLAEVRRRFDGPEMDRLGVSPGCWSQWADEAAAHLCELLHCVREHIRAGARDRLGMVIWLE